MKITIFKRITLVAAIFALSLAGMSMLANAQEKRQDQKKWQTRTSDKKQQEAQEQLKEDQNKQQKQRTEQQRQQDQNKLQQDGSRQQHQQDQNQIQQQRVQQQRDQNSQQQQRVQQQQDKKRSQERAQQRPWQRDRDWQDRVQQQSPNQQQARRPQERQQQLIREQQQRATQYSRNLDQKQRDGQQYAAELKRQGRAEHYRYQQDYIGRLRDQGMRLRNERHDYDNDPFFNIGWNYRYYRGGRYYETNQYGANMLREAVNYGYEQGFLAGRADKQDRWRFNYQNTYAYQDANYGYGGYYVPQSEYNYYFRQGFRRGYEDGYYNRYRNGRYSDGKYTILGAILGSILDMQSLH